MTRFAEVEQFLNDHGFTKTKTGKKHVFSNGRDRINVVKSTEISSKLFDKIKKQALHVVKQNAKTQDVPSKVPEAPTPAAPKPANPTSLSDLLLESFHKVIAASNKHSGTSMTIASFMSTTGLPPHRLTAIIASASEYSDIDTLFALKTALQKVSIEPKALKDALHKIDGMTSPTTAEMDEPVDDFTDEELELEQQSIELENEEVAEAEEDMTSFEEKEENSSAVIVKRAIKSQDRSSIYPWHSDSRTPSSGPKIIIPMVKAKENPEQLVETAEGKTHVEETTNTALENTQQVKTIAPRRLGFSTKQQAILEIASILSQFPNLEDSEYREMTDYAVNFMKFNK